MEFDFAALLLGLTVLFGLVWAFDRLFLYKARKRRAAERGKDVHDPWPVDWARSLFPVVLLVLLLRSFVAEPFRIPSGSMMPTLRTGDFILVNKFAYGLRLPVFHNKIIDLGEPKRGDIVVFRPPWAPGQNWIKRVVGLPGDRVVMHGEHLFINGKRVPEQLEGAYSGNPDDREDRLLMDNGGIVLHEHLGTVHHRIIEMPQAHRAPDLPNSDNPEIVPPNCYLVLGDNRDDSEDSRYEGCVQEKDLVGKAFLIWFAWDHGVAFSRIGDLIH